MKIQGFFISAVMVCTLSVMANINYVDIPDQPSMDFDHGARIDAAMCLFYDTFKDRNEAYVYGGRGKNSAGQEIYMDSNGDLWNFWFENAFTCNADTGGVVWKRVSTDPFRLRDLEDFDPPYDLQDEPYPPRPRYGHSAVICPTLDCTINHNMDIETSKETHVNFIMFGGGKQVAPGDPLIGPANEEITDELYVFSTYSIVLSDGLQTRGHWYRIEPDAVETWPSPRKYAQIVPLFNEATPIEERNRFLLFGGVNDSGLICNDAFVGTFTRNTLVQPPEDNEWFFNMGLDVTFIEVTIDDASAIQVYGASAVYDPYFHHPPAEPDPVPRVIVLGGIDCVQGYVTDDVNVLLPVNGIWSHIHVDDTNMLHDFNDKENGHERAFFSATLNYRLNRIEVIGGESNEGTLDEIGYLDILTTGYWEYIPGPGDSGDFPQVSHHSAGYSLGTTAFCAENWNTMTPARKLYMDRGEWNQPREWVIRKGYPNGLDNPETVINTRRLGPGDTIYIYQDNDGAGAVNDCYNCCLAVPKWCPYITIEGKVRNGVKPVLYQLYTPVGVINDASYLSGAESGRFQRSMSEI
ncbi:MAG TPA: hypothetical protein PLV45_12595, partial [bacterium]|nr:hypothetical protein [bacterium]